MRRSGVKTIYENTPTVAILWLLIGEKFNFCIEFKKKMSVFFKPNRYLVSPAHNCVSMVKRIV